MTHKQKGQMEQGFKTVFTLFIISFFRALRLQGNDTKFSYSSRIPIPTRNQSFEEKEGRNRGRPIKGLMIHHSTFLFFSMHYQGLVSISS